jgi:hypothetical protein
LGEKKRQPQADKFKMMILAISNNPKPLKGLKAEEITNNLP